MSDIGHNSAPGQLRAFIERIERLEEEIKSINDDKSEVYKEARGSGFDVKTMRKVIAARKLDEADRQEADALFDMYMSALGMPPHVRVHVHVENIEQFRDDPAAATETAGDYLREPAAVVSGQIIREGDAPRETDRQASEQSPGDGDASSPDTDFEPPAFLVKREPLRPHCLSPELCASGGGSEHCHRCKKAMAEAGDP